MRKNILKRLIMLITVISVVLSIVVTASAAAPKTEPEISPLDINDAVKYATLSISNAKATCFAYYYDKTEESRYIEISLTLEKHTFLWFWERYIGTWTKGIGGYTTSFSTTRSNLPSGTYRLKAEFTITLMDRSKQTYTYYTNEINVP